MYSHNVSLDHLMLKDPNLPSIAYQAHEHASIYIPWIGQSPVLGVGFDSSIASKTGRTNSSETSQTHGINNALRPSAFASTPGQVTHQLEFTNNGNSIREVSSTHASTSYEHMDFKGSFSVGGSFLGASGRGRFSNTVSENKDV